MFASIRKLFDRDARVAPVPPAPPAVPDWRTQGNAALAAGDLDRAAASYRTGTQPPPGHPVAWLNLGYVQLERGEHAQARASLATAQQLMAPDDPALPDAWALIGRERQESSDWPGAAAAYERAVELVPTHELAWRELGQVYEVQGRLAEAETAYLRALALRGDFESALRDLARLLLRLGQEKGALPFIERCLKLAEVHPETHLLHARALAQLGQLAEAVEATGRGLALGYDETLMILRGRTLTRLGRAAEALDCHAGILGRNPGCVDALVDSGRALILMARYEEALGFLERANAIRPGQVDIVGNKVAALMAQLRCGEALAAIDGELSPQDAAHPEIAFLAGLIALLSGDFERGWRGYASRWQLPDRRDDQRKPDFQAPDWRGEPLAGRAILVYCEQGLGDALQMLRYLPLLAERAARVWFQLHATLRPLMPALPANCELLPDGAAVPRVDYACSMMELPAAFGTTVRTVPARVPYLQVPTDRLAHWRERLGPGTGRLRVGLVWSGNPGHVNDHNRSIPLALVRAAAGAVGADIEFISLQKEVRAGDVDVLRDWPALRQLGDQLETFGDTAAVATLLDRVITVDTSVAHLVGALGRPLSVMLPYCPDWRWLLDRDDSPWYPTAKLYRQPAPGAWGPVLERAIAEAGARAV